MIITKPREWARVNDNLARSGAKKVFIMGCGECATVANTGGEPRSSRRSRASRPAGCEVTGWTVGEVACHSGGTALEMRKHARQVEAADAVLVLACGAGVQTVADATEQPGVPGARERVPRQRGPARRVRGALPDVRRLRAGQDRRHLSGHHVPEGAAQRPVRRHVERQVRGAARPRVHAREDQAGGCRAGPEPRGAHRSPRTTRRS